MMKTSLILLLTFLSNLILAQSSSKYIISGSIVDSLTNNSLIGVNIVVNSQVNDSFISGAASNAEGKFRIERVDESKIRMKFSFIGYNTKIIDTVYNGQHLKLGQIKLQLAAILTSEVLVQSTKPMIEYFIDKQVINIEKVPGNNGSVADALRNSGVVDVDPSTSKVSIRGKSDVKIMIDGKPMVMAENILDQLPASSVDKVEVITSSSAKDDPEGDAGILNIVTKSGGLGSYSGSVFIAASNKKMNFGNIMLNYRTGKFNFFSTVMAGIGGMRFENNYDRINYNSFSFYNQKTLSMSDMDGYLTNIKLGFDYDFDSSNTFTFTGNYYKLKYDQDDKADGYIYNQNIIPVYNYLFRNKGKMDNDNYTFTGFYKKKINISGEEFTIDAFYSNLKNDFDTEQSTELSYHANFPALQNTINDIKNNTVIIKTDYVHPGAIGKFETGYHYTFRDRANDYNILNYSYNNLLWYDSLKNSNLFSYKENIHALYLMYTNNISKFEYKAGVRLEQTYTEGDQSVTGEVFNGDYVSLFPSLMLSYKFTDQMPLSLSYSRRINRPKMEFINPFIIYSGPYNITKGNPKLAPTYVNLYELKFSQLLNVYYSYAKGSPQQVESSFNDTISLSTRINLSSIKTYGMEVTIPYYNDPKFPVKLPQFINFIFLKYTLNRFVQSGSYEKENLSYSKNFWNLSANAGFKTIFDIELIFSFRYIPKLEDERNISYSNKYLFLVFNKNFMDNKLKVNLSFNDVLNSKSRRTVTYGSNFYSDFDFINRLSRGVFLSFNYSFNDFKTRRDRNVDDGRDKSDEGFLGD